VILSCRDRCQNCEQQRCNNLRVVLASQRTPFVCGVRGGVVPPHKSPTNDISVTCCSSGKRAASRASTTLSSSNRAALKVATSGPTAASERSSTRIVNSTASTVSRCMPN
jgi:hypothetical protein